MQWSQDPAARFSPTPPPAPSDPAPLTLHRRLSSLDGRRHNYVIATAWAGAAPFGITHVSGVMLTLDDWVSTAHGSWISDSVIAACAVALNAGTPSGVYMLDPFFFPILAREGWSGVRKCGRHVGARSAELDRVLAPLNLSGYHWTLEIGDAIARTWEHYDPLHAGRTDAIDALARLRDWWVKWFGTHPRAEAPELGDATSWRIHHASPEWPRQRDAHSCGVFILAVAAALNHGNELSFSHADAQRMRKTPGRALLMNATLRAVLNVPAPAAWGHTSPARTPPATPAPG